MKVGYVVEQYPQFSTPFIVDEIAAHEDAGLEIEIFSLNPSTDTHYLPSIARVGSPVRFLAGSSGADELWSQMRDAGDAFPSFWNRLAEVREDDVRTIAQAIELARLVGQNGVSHLHAHFATAPTTVARLAASLANVSYSFTAHTEDLIGADVDEADLASKIKDASGTITDNDFSREYIEQAFGKKAGRIERVYAGLRTDMLPFTSPASRSRQIVAVGPLEETSGFEFLIEAVAKLNGAGKPVRCDIYGRGSLEGKLRELIASHDLRDSVKIVVSASAEEVENQVRNASVLVAPSVVAEDGSTPSVPEALLEAMTVGTPCLSTDVGGIPEIIVDGQTGVQVPQKDADALAKAIKELVSDDVKRVRLALKARVLVESEFNIHRNAERMRSFFGPSRGDGAVSEPDPAHQAEPTPSERAEDDATASAEAATSNGSASEPLEHHPDQ